MLMVGTLHGTVTLKDRLKVSSKKKKGFSYNLEISILGIFPRQISSLIYNTQSW